MNIETCSLQKPLSCLSTASIVEVAQALCTKECRQILVVEKDAPVGIISTTDIVARVVAAKKDPSKTQAKDIMTQPIHSLDAATSVEKAYLFMIQKNLFSIPVTKQGKLVGILPFSKSLGQNKC